MTRIRRSSVGCFIGILAPLILLFSLSLSPGQEEFRLHGLVFENQQQMDEYADAHQGATPQDLQVLIDQYNGPSPEQLLQEYADAMAAMQEGSSPQALPSDFGATAGGSAVSGFHSAALDGLAAAAAGAVLATVGDAADGIESFTGELNDLLGNFGVEVEFLQQIEQYAGMAGGLIDCLAGLFDWFSDGIPVQLTTPGYTPAEPADTGDQADEGEEGEPAADSSPESDAGATGPASTLPDLPDVPSSDPPDRPSAESGRRDDYDRHRDYENWSR
ncbi:hypothetical protein ACFLSJ_03575 [Verrucomicrobiota bacterium]